jgi:molybdopterin synthase sulfur carrier subunit
MFGPAREAAGTGSDELAGDTLGAVLHEAVGRYGEAFAVVLGHSAVWVNGERAAPDRALSEADEVAILPPVSGG